MLYKRYLNLVERFDFCAYPLAFQCRTVSLDVDIILGIDIQTLQRVAEVIDELVADNSFIRPVHFFNRAVQFLGYYHFEGVGIQTTTPFDDSLRSGKRFCANITRILTYDVRTYDDVIQHNTASETVCALKGYLISL